MITCETLRAARHVNAVTLMGMQLPLPHAHIADSNEYTAMSRASRMKVEHKTICLL